MELHGCKSLALTWLCRRVEGSKDSILQCSCIRATGIVALGSLHHQASRVGMENGWSHGSALSCWLGLRWEASSSLFRPAVSNLFLTVASGDQEGSVAESQSLPGVSLSSVQLPAHVAHCSGLTLNAQSKSLILR